jgi:hypothetical protein
MMFEVLYQVGNFSLAFCFAWICAINSAIETSSKGLFLKERFWILLLID